MMTVPNLGRLGALALALCLVALPVLAADGGAIDLSPLVGELLIGLASVAVGVLTWGLKRWTGVSISAEARATLDGAAGRAAERLIAKHGKRLTLDTGSPLLAEGVDYVLTRVPDAVKRLGGSREAIADRLVAEIAKRLPAG